MAGWMAIAKKRKTNRVRPDMRARKLFTNRPPEYGFRVSNRRWLQSVIHITSRRNAICALESTVSYNTPGADTERVVGNPSLTPEAGWLPEILGGAEILVGDE